MDFKDWRLPPAGSAGEAPTHEQTGASTESEQRAPGKRYRGKRFADYIDEQIREAEERGAFRNLPGLGQPLKIDMNPDAGEKALGYSLLKGNGYLPTELELAREIDRDLERLAIRRYVLSKRGRDLRRRRVAPFASEKRAYNTAVRKALTEYEAALHALNRKILTLNLTVPSVMHRVPLDVEGMLREFREACPLFS